MNGKTPLSFIEEDGIEGLPREVVRSLGKNHQQEGVGSLLRLLTQLANCGLSAGAPTVLRSVHHRV